MAGTAAAGTAAGARGQALLPHCLQPFRRHRRLVIGEDARPAPAPSPVFDWQGEWLASDER